MPSRLEVSVGRRGLLWNYLTAPVVGAASSLLCACAFVPPLEQATGTTGSNILVADIVKRVKCEIADSFDHKTEDPRFRWLQDWTVKTDLTLQINDQAGVTPSGSFTTYRKNAFNFAAGSTSLTSNTIGFVQQFFTLGASANLSEQAVRTEVVSFSLSLKELKIWKEELDRLDNSRGIPLDKRICYPSGRPELTGNLGLREWVDSALYPVDVADLLAGNHPAPGAAQPKPPPSGIPAPKPPTIGVAAGEAGPKLTREKIQSLFEEITAATDKAKEASSQLSSSVAKAQAAHSQVISAVKSMHETWDVYAHVSTAEITNRIALAIGTLEKIARYADKDAKTATDAQKNDQSYEQIILPNYNDFAKNFPNETYDEKGIQKSNVNYQAEHDVVLKYKPFIDNEQTNAKLAADHMQELQSLAAQVSVKPDPPEDSLLHSLQFVVAYGGNVSPSWTLIAWKGPSFNGPLLGAQGIRTHILNIALGPRGAPDATSEQARLIANQTILLSHN